MKILTFGKITLTAITLTAILSGCGGVDQEKLAMLTSGKNFNQIEQGYIRAKINGNEENIEIYEYWLQKNGAKVNPTFDFDLYKIKTEKDIQKQLAAVKKEKKQFQKMYKKELKSIQSGHRMNYRAISTIDRKLSMLYYLPQDMKFVKEYVSFLKNIEKKLQDAEKKRKKEWKEKSQRELENSLHRI